MDNKTRAIVYVIIASLLFSFMAFFSKSFKEEGIGSFGVAEVRLLLTAIGCGVIMLIFHRDQFKIERGDVVLFFGLAIAKMLMDATYFYSLQTEMDSTVALVLQMTMPFFVLILSFFVFKEEINMRKKIALVIGIIGIAICGGFLTGQFNGGLKGVVYAIASGFFYAVYSVGGKELANRKYSANTVLFYTFGIASIGIMPLAMQYNIVNFADAINNNLFITIRDVLCMGIFCSLIPFYLLQKARELTDATTVAMTSLTGVAFTAIIGLLLLNHAPTTIELVGIAIMMVSLVIMNGKIDKKRTNEENKPRK